MKRWVFATTVLAIVMLLAVPGVAATTATTVDPEFSLAGDGTVSVPWALAAGLFAFVFVGLGGYLFSRMSGAVSKRTDPSRPTGQDRDQ